MKIIKKITALILALAMLLSLTACGEEFESYRPVDNLEDLEMRKIGVQMGWGTDYYMSEREDVILYRYDTLASMLVALCYKKVDAVIVSVDVWADLHKIVTGIQRYPDPIFTDQNIVYFAEGREDIRDKFNAWLAEWKTTEQYQEWYARQVDPDYSYDDLCFVEDFTGTGEEVNLCYANDFFPMSYTDTDGKGKGYEVEMLMLFCNAMNYKVNVYGVSESATYTGLQTGRYDIDIASNSVLYLPELETLGILHSDPYADYPYYLVEASDRDNVKITADIDY